MNFLPNFSCRVVHIPNTVHTSPHATCQHTVRASLHAMCQHTVCAAPYAMCQHTVHAALHTIFQYTDVLHHMPCFSIQQIMTYPISLQPPSMSHNGCISSTIYTPVLYPSLHVYAQSCYHAYSCNMACPTLLQLPSMSHTGHISYTPTHLYCIHHSTLNFLRL